MPTQELSASGRKKILIISILLLVVIFLVGFVGVLYLSSAPDDVLLPDTASFISLTDSSDGVDVTIENIKKENGRTTIELSFNNHQYDLSTMDVKSNSNFSGVKPKEYKINGTAMGGHHVQSEMVFEGELSGLLAIVLDESLIFNFNIQ